jgi:RNA polymerase sigma-70 factor (sigma-E family)
MTFMRATGRRGTVDNAAEERFADWAASRVRGLHRTAYLLCGDWHVAEDLVQESLARTALHWKHVESAEHPDAYVRAILVNQARSRWRRRSTREHRVFMPSDTGIADGSDDRARRDELMVALRRLPARQRAVVVLRYFEELSEAETAAALGCSPGTVKSHSHRALQSLRSVMTEEGSHADR